MSTATLVQPLSIEPHPGALAARDAAPDEPAANGRDVLSAFLAPCRFRYDSILLAQLSAAWGLRFETETAAFLLVLEGRCWLETPTETEPVALGCRDFCLLTRECGFVVRDHPDSPSVLAEWRDDQPATGPQPVRRLGGGGVETRLACVRLTFDDEYSRRAFALLPALLHVPAQTHPNNQPLHSLVEALADELAERRSGSECLVKCLVQGLMVQALRIHPMIPGETGTGLIAALRTPGLGAVLGEIHARPEHAWSVHELADIAGLSRAAFAVRFLDVLGRPPFQYLRDARMQLSCQLLRDTDHGVKEIAARVGYSTEASFSKAFTRWQGIAPGEYRRRGREACSP